MTFLAVICLVPLLKNQFVVGPIVNGLLFSSVMILGVFPAILLCILPSCIALLAGILPISFAFMIPFIVISNILLVTAFSAFYKNTYFGASLLASVLKFFFLFGAIFLFLKTNTLRIEAEKLTLMFGYIQLASALIGSILAYGVKKLF
jgi:hypothetical protein